VIGTILDDKYRIDALLGRERAGEAFARGGTLSPEEAADLAGEP
jgi:hypothetical protein